MYACVRAFFRSFVCAFVRACVRACVLLLLLLLLLLLEPDNVDKRNHVSCGNIIVSIDFFLPHRNLTYCILIFLVISQSAITNQ